MPNLFREHIKQLLGAISLLIALTACTSENYDVGDGKNSYLTADFVLLRTSADRSVRSAMLDDNTTLQFSNPFVQDWLERPDTVYRALLYYDRASTATGSTSEANAPVVRARSVKSVPVLRPMELSTSSNMRTDPVGFESLWLSPNGSYINLSLLLKSGKAEENEKLLHTLGIVSNGTTSDANGRTTLHLALYHDQGGVPEYYTQQHFLSVDTRSLESADEVEIAINTYNGTKSVRVVVAKQ